MSSEGDRERVMQIPPGRTPQGERPRIPRGVAWQASKRGVAHGMKPSGGTAATHDASGFRADRGYEKGNGSWNRESADAASSSSAASRPSERREQARWQDAARRNRCLPGRRRRMPRPPPGTIGRGCLRSSISRRPSRMSPRPRITTSSSSAPAPRASPARSPRPKQAPKSRSSRKKRRHRPTAIQDRASITRTAIRPTWPRS